MDKSWRDSLSACLTADMAVGLPVDRGGVGSLASGRPGDRERASSGVPGAALRTALVAGLDRLSHGVAVLNGAGDLVYANAAAQALWNELASGDHERASRSAPTAWSLALRRVCDIGLRELVRFDARGRFCVAVLSPLVVEHEKMAFAVFSREQICGSVELQMFARTCQLTHAETVVLRKLSLGMSASAIATEHGVASTTVHTQIAAVRDKTQCSSVRKLLAVLARMPPINPLQLVRPSSEGFIAQEGETSWDVDLKR